MALHLIIGNKNYSSWSFRPWLGMKAAGIAFEETVISLEAADFKARVTALSGAGRVPVLIDGEVRVWESLAILEYLAEKFPAAAAMAGRRPRARAHARAVASEMHAGFAAAAPATADEYVAAGEAARARRRSRGQCGADRDDLERVPGEIRRPVSVRRIRRGGCDVRAGRVAVSHLCGRGRRRRAVLHESGDGAAGLERMARCRAARAMGAAA